MNTKTNYLQKISFLLMSAVTLMILNSFNSSAQQDSMKVTYTEETKDSSNYLFRQKYRYIDINMKNETNLLKIGLQTSVLLTSKRGVQLSFEHKIKPSLSVLGKAAYLTYVNHRDTAPLFPNTYGVLIIESRWYYSINKKIKNGVCGNNFNNNYLCFGIGKIISREEKPYLMTTMGWGIQRRLNNIGYVDVSFRANVGLKSKKNDIDKTTSVIDIDETINLEIGFGKSFKKKR